MLTSLPNLLTLSRIVAIPILVALLFVKHPAAAWLACIIFTVAAVTDYFDGHLARTRRQIRIATDVRRRFSSACSTDHHRSHRGVDECTRCWPTRTPPPASKSSTPTLGTAA